MTETHAKTHTEITFVSALTHPEVKEHIEKGSLLVEIPPLKATYQAADAHPDLYIHVLAANPPQLFIAPQADNLFRSLPAPARSALSALSCRRSSRPLTAAYPGNIGLNAVSTAKFFIHNLDHTDPFLLKAAESSGLTMIHVKQGYTKCNVAVVSDDAFITSDKGIARALSRSSHSCSVLEISPGFVELPGLPVGFLGGASGLVRGELIVNGDLSLHPDFAQITAFCRSHNRRIRWFDDLPLVDVGSIVTVSLSV